MHVREEGLWVSARVRDEHFGPPIEDRGHRVPVKHADLLHRPARHPLLRSGTAHGTGDTQHGIG